MKNPVSDSTLEYDGVVKGSDMGTKDIAQVQKLLKAAGLPEGSLDAEKRRQQKRNRTFGVSLTRAWRSTFRIARTKNEKSN